MTNSFRGYHKSIFSGEFPFNMKIRNGFVSNSSSSSFVIAKSFKVPSNKNTPYYYILTNSGDTNRVSFTIRKNIPSKKNEVSFEHIYTTNDSYNEGLDVTKELCDHLNNHSNLLEDMYFNEFPIYLSMFFDELNLELYPNIKNQLYQLVIDLRLTNEVMEVN